LAFYCGSFVPSFVFPNFSDALKRRIPAVLLYVSSTGSMLVGIVAQTLGFVILARFLGTDQYGYLATISAATNLACPLCGLGASEAMRRCVSRDPGLYPVVFGHCLILLGVTGVILVSTISASLALFVRVLPNPLANVGVILLLVSSNVALYTWIGFVEQIFLAHSQFKRANIVNGGFGIARALAVVVACFGFGVDHLLSWAMWNTGVYLGASLVCAAAIRSYGPPQWRLIRGELTLGMTMSGAGFLFALRQNVDILALSSIETTAVVGAYGLARRVIATASVLGASLDRQIYAKLVIAGKVGPAATLRLARTYAVYALALTVSASLALFAFAPMMPWVFGKGFGEAIPILRVLCWTLVFGAIQNVAFDALNAADRHHAQFVAGTATGLFGAILVAALTHAYGITGAFAGAYLSEGAMALALWGTLVFLSDRQRKTPRELQ
jgi:O-antigen/teichoic acid export membrane protein